MAEGKFARHQQTTSQFGELTIVRVGAGRFDLADPYHTALSLSWPGFLLLVLSYYVLVNLIFGALYFLLPGSVSGLEGQNFWMAFFFSVETFATVGYGQMAPSSTAGHIIATAEIILGMLSTAVITGLLFVRLAQPRARILFSPVAVVCQFDGVPTLMLRIANGRANAIRGVSAEVTYVAERITIEGISTFVNVPVQLVRSHMPVFAMGWTLMHHITPESPLYGVDFEAAPTSPNRPRITVATTGFDETLSAPVFANESYGFDDIRVGHQFVDLMERKDRRVIVNLMKIGETVPQSR